MTWEIDKLWNVWFFVVLAPSKWMICKNRRLIFFCSNHLETLLLFLRVEFCKMIFLKFHFFRYFSTHNLYLDYLMKFFNILFIEISHCDIFYKSNNYNGLWNCEISTYHWLLISSIINFLLKLYLSSLIFFSESDILRFHYGPRRQGSSASASYCWKMKNYWNVVKTCRNILKFA